MHWPGGRGTQLRLDGRARDLLTTTDGDARVVAEDVMSVGVSTDRTIEDVEVEPDRTGVRQLVGAQAGRRFRAVLDEAVPGDRDAGTPLYLILDDVAGSSLIAGFAWSRWTDALAVTPADPEVVAAMMSAYKPRKMEGICSGFRPGSSALDADGYVNRERRHNVAVVPALADPDDPIGWHTLPVPPAVAMRRARRIDVWDAGDQLVVDAMFRDSCWQPDGIEVAVHEYRLDATVDRAGEHLTSVTAEPRVLPFAECPAAAPNVSRLAGAPLRGLRTEVLERLQSTDCCTHLNDALRSLAELPTLVAALRGSPER
jgi:Protein of unknown function (DUF2889)